jgi:hypothetical protein
LTVKNNLPISPLFVSQPHCPSHFPSKTNPTASVRAGVFVNGDINFANRLAVFLGKKIESLGLKDIFSPFSV